MILMKEFLPLTTVAIEKSKRNFLNGQWKMLQKENASLETRILQMQTTTEKIELIGYLILGDITFCSLKNLHTEKKSPKS